MKAGRVKAPGHSQAPHLIPENANNISAAQIPGVNDFVNRFLHSSATLKSTCSSQLQLTSI